MIINYLTKLPVGVMTIAINVPLFASAQTHRAGYDGQRKHFAVKHIFYFFK